MRQDHALFAFVLALIWVPMTMCCEMQAVGWEITCCDTGCDADESAAAEDQHTRCDCPFQNGHVQSHVHLLKLAPNMALLTDWSDRPALDQSMTGDVPSEYGRESRPLHWVNIWQFKRRAAALAHAPDLLII